MDKEEKMDSSEEVEEQEDIAEEVAEDNENGDASDADADDDADDDANEEEETPAAGATAADAVQKVGMLDQPLVVEGKRKKHSVDRLRVVSSKPADRTAFEVPVGPGIALGEIDAVNAAVTRVKSDELKILHRLLFGTPGKKLDVKKHIRHFSGFVFDDKDKQFEAKRDFINKYGLSIVKEICDYLGQAHTGTKVQCIDRILEFLQKPTAEGLTARAALSESKITPKKRRRSASPTKAAKSPAKKTDRSKSPAKKSTTPKKAPAKTTPSKSPSVSRRKSQTPKKIATTVDSDDSSDDEPLSKKLKTPFPTDDELESAAQGILKKADMESVTIKSVLQQVYRKFDSHDLSGKKDFLKSTIKDLYSEMTT